MPAHVREHASSRGERTRPCVFDSISNHAVLSLSLIGNEAHPQLWMLFQLRAGLVRLDQLPWMRKPLLEALVESGSGFVGLVGIRACLSLRASALYRGFMEGVRRLGAMHRERQADLRRLRAGATGPPSPNPLPPPRSGTRDPGHACGRARSLLRKRGHVGRLEFQAESSHVGRS